MQLIRYAKYPVDNAGSLLHIDKCSRTDLYRALMQIGADIERLEKTDPSKKKLRQIYRTMLAQQLRQWKFGEFIN